MYCRNIYIFITNEQEIEMVYSKYTKKKYYYTISSGQI